MKDGTLGTVLRFNSSPPSNLCWKTTFLFGDGLFALRFACTEVAKIKHISPILGGLMVMNLMVESENLTEKTHRRKWQSFVNRAKGIYILGNYLQVISPKPSAQLLIIYIRLNFGQKGEKTTIKSQKGDSKELKAF